MSTGRALIHEGNLGWWILGGAAGAFALFAFTKTAKAEPASGKLPLATAKKVNAQIAASRDPVFLKKLAAGLQAGGNTPEALAALQKAASITGKPEQVPGAMSLPETVITPGGSVASVAAPSASTYTVAAGDIPGAIAKRFGLGLAQLAKANGSKGQRIMGGKIQVGETLLLPPGAVDSGPQKRATGVAA